MAESARQHSNLIPRVNPGDDIKARDWNHVGDHINRQNTGVRMPRQLPNVADNASEALFARFRIKTIEGNFLICVKWNGFVEGIPGDQTAVPENILVARPFLLRTITTEHNGVTFVYSDNVTRTASAAGETDETQVIVPAYVVDDEIIAFKGVVRGNGAIGPANNPILWQDLNIDARAWAKQAS